MRHTLRRLRATSILILSVTVLSGCSMQQVRGWQWNPFERKSTASGLPTMEMDFSPNRTAPRIASRPSLPTEPLARTPQGEQQWSGGAHPRAWRYIVIHHSASESGSAALFHRQHLDRGWDELGYHFVIDNGNGGPDGRVEVGPRWRKQKHGAHCGGTPGNEYNEVGIGICLVGNFQDRMPSDRQLRSLNELVAYLVATYNIPPDRVIAHRDAPGAATECCGRTFYANLDMALRPSLTPNAYARR